ncbi:ABC transporter permease [candidate division KSB3 bacterium]|jgi:simple sugar transport system permease protein|uniref:ABC transporter permease n=1 Tax=candidate division KSB3 bacterium TaxID=2044937 RepID=A0A9D5Q6T8_9BACT|nr:ABC transporter permease [candidate division KSB3 bacterium]MBD3326145.1 ABC transporter permease [candidate division KSB3 bacterium]
MSGLFALLASAIRLAVPYTLAGLGGTYSERSGVVNIGLEGMMLTGAFTAVAVANKSGSPWLGLCGAIGVGMLLGLIHALVCVTLKSNQIISGLAINIFASGVTVFFSWLLFNLTQIQVEDKLLFPVLQIPPILPLTVVIVVASHFIIFKTTFGLRLRSVGEHPQAADTLGISVYKMRYAGVMISGALAGLAGAFLSLEHAHYFVKNMSGGKGFIGLATMIFGKWTPLGTAGAGLLFGFGEAVSLRVSSAGIPPQFIDMIPYVITMFVLAGVVGRATPPAADGIPYSKE